MHFFFADTTIELDFASKSEHPLSFGKGKNSMSRFVQHERNTNRRPICAMAGQLRNCGECWRVSMRERERERCTGSRVSSNHTEDISEITFCEIANKFTGIRRHEKEHMQFLPDPHPQIAPTQARSSARYLRAGSILHNLERDIERLHRRQD